MTTKHKISGRKKLSKGRRFWRGVGIAILAFFAITIMQVVILKWVPVWYTPLMVRRKVEAVKEGRSLEIKHDWVAFDDISSEMPRAVIASENNLFLKDNGFSERGLKQAIQEKQKKGKVRHGGSTITQQTAKNVFTFGTRTYVRKAFEAYYTVLINYIWGKKRVMEVYLNVIEMGDGVFGVEAASEQFFHHSAKRLTRSESALIAVCLPNPRKMLVDHPSSYVRGRQAHIIGLMPKMGRLDFDHPKKEQASTSSKKHGSHKNGRK